MGLLNKKILFKTSNGLLVEGTVIGTDPSEKAYSVLKVGSNMPEWFEKDGMIILSVLGQGINESGNAGEQLING